MDESYLDAFNTMFIMTRVINTMVIKTRAINTKIIRRPACGAWH
jgi:hypothetical protein